MRVWVKRAAESFNRTRARALRGSMSRLSTKLTLAMVTLVVVTAVIIEIVTFHGIERAILPPARASIDAQVRLLAAEFDAYVDAVRADVRGFRAAVALDGILRASQNGGVHPADGTSVDLWRKRMASRFVVELNEKAAYLKYRIIGVADGGRELVRADRSGPGNSVRSVPDGELQQKGNAPYMAAILALRPGETYISNIGLNRENGEIEQPPVPILRVATLLFAEDGAPFGVLIVNMDLRPIFARIRAATQPDENVYVVNEHGDYIQHSDRGLEFGFEFGKPHRIQDDYPGFATLLQSDGVWDDVFSDSVGETFVAAAVRIKFGPEAAAAVVKIVPYSAIMAPVRSIGYSALLAGIAAAVGAIVLAIILARSLTRPLRQMTVAVQKFSRNEPMVAPVSAGGEIGLLARTFQNMAENLRESASQLERGSAERQRIFDTSVNLIIVIDRRGKLSRVSPSSMQVLGYTPEEMSGRDSADFVFAEDLNKAREEMRKVRRGGDMRNCEVRYTHKDGHIVTLSWGGVWSDPEQQYFFIGSDITEQKFAEEMFRLAVMASPSGMLMVDRSARIIMVNDALEQQFGYERPRAAITGKKNHTEVE